MIMQFKNLHLADFGTWLCKLAFAICCLLVFSVQMATQEKTQYICGIAIGYPPYQYVDVTNQPAGLDVDVTRLVFREMAKKFVFKQANWDYLLLGFTHSTLDIDVLCGAEVDEVRKTSMDFSAPYYYRKSVLFIRSTSNYTKIEDLYGKIVTGDRDSFLESRINRSKLRIMSTTSKDESFRLLQANLVEGVIAPLEVGNYVAKHAGLSVSVISVNDPGSPVAFAVAKGNQALAREISRALETIRQRGDLARVIKKYQ